MTQYIRTEFVYEVDSDEPIHTVDMDCNLQEGEIIRLQVQNDDPTVWTVEDIDLTVRVKSIHKTVNTTYPRGGNVGSVSSTLYITVVIEDITPEAFE